MAKKKKAKVASVGLAALEAEEFSARMEYSNLNLLENFEPLPSVEELAEMNVEDGGLKCDDPVGFTYLTDEIASAAAYVEQALANWEDSVWALFAAKYPAKKRRQHEHRGRNDHQLAGRTRSRPAA